MKQRFPLFLFLVVFLVPCIGVTAQEDLRIDRTELEDTGTADIDFENYQGPVERIETREEIRGIGRYLGIRAEADSTVDYYERYSLTRIIGEDEDGKRAADILDLSPRARVDHIVNLRRIIAGYLEESWSYESGDADFLARIITIYNAVHRGSMNFFEERYRRAVLDFLDPAKAGLAISYRDWPGNTQLVVPIRTDRAPGDLDAVDSSPLVDQGVLAELRARRDLGVEERKAIIEFVERVIEERTEAIVEERREIAEERQEIEQRREEIDEEIAAIEEQPAETAPMETTPAETAPTESAPAEPPQREAAPEEPAVEQPAPTEGEPDGDRPSGPVTVTEPELTPVLDEQPEPSQQREALEEERRQLDEREEALDEREEQVDQDEADVEELQEQVQEIYEDTAEDQAALESGDVPPPRALFPVRQPDGAYDVTVFETVDLGVVGEQTISTVRPDLPQFQGSVLIVDSRAERLLAVDPLSLEVLYESDSTVPAGADVLVDGAAIFSVVQVDGGYYVGEFDARLVLIRRSRREVLPDTEIVLADRTILVQATDRTVISLDREEFE